METPNFTITIDNTDGTYSTSIEADGASPEFAILYGLAVALSETETLDVERKLVERAAEYMKRPEHGERLNTFFAVEALGVKVKTDFTIEIKNTDKGFEYSLNTRGAPHIVPFMIEALLDDMTNNPEATDIERDFMLLGTQKIMENENQCSH